MGKPGEENNEEMEEEVQEIDTSSLDYVSEPHPASGMAQYMKEFLGTEADSSSDDEEDNKDEDDKSSDEVFTIERFSEDENTKFTELIDSKEKLTDEDFADFKLSEEELTAVKTKFADKFTEDKKDDFGNGKLEELEKPALIEEVKKNQRFVSDRNTKIQELENKVKTLEEKPTVTDEKLKSFITDIKQDLVNGWKKHSKDLELPDIGLIQASGSSGSVEDRLLDWQENTLKDQIEKEFELEKGEFEVVKEDLFQPKTASYRWRTATEAKEKELQKELQDLSNAEKTRLADIQRKQTEDIKWYADTFAGGDQNEVVKLVSEINDIPAKIAKGELTPEKHPFSLRNLLVSYKYDELVKKAVNDAVAQTTKQFNEKGIYLENEDELPTDLTKIKKAASEKKKIEFDKKLISNSPMLRNVNDMLNG